MCTHTFEKLLLQLGLGDLDLDGLVNLLRMSALVVCVVLDGGREEGVDEGGLSKSGFSSNLEYVNTRFPFSRFSHRDAYHNSERGASLCDNLVSLVGQIRNPNRGRAFRSRRSHYWNWTGVKW